MGTRTHTAHTSRTSRVCARAARRKETCPRRPTFAYLRDVERRDSKRRASRRQRALAGSVILAALTCFYACKDPTQVTLDISYRGPCSDVRGTAIVIGVDPASVEDRVTRNVYTTETTSCSTDGSLSKIGSLVVTPSDSSSRGALIVIAGIDKPPSQCKPADGYFGCIISRRSFAFVSHSDLNLPVILEPDCKNVPCAAGSTCLHGACVGSESKCSGGNCDDFGVSDDGGRSLVDAPTSSDGAVDGSLLDAPVDSPTSSGEGCATHDVPVTCGGSFPCAPGTPCCTMVGSGSGGGQIGCMQACPYMRVSCRDSTNCAAGQVCCLVYPSSTTCTATSSCPGQVTCTQDCDCPKGQFCGPQAPNGYRTCSASVQL